MNSRRKVSDASDPFVTMSHACVSDRFQAVAQVLRNIDPALARKLGTLVGVEYFRNTKSCECFLQCRNAKVRGQRVRKPEIQVIYTSNTNYSREIKKP